VADSTPRSYAHDLLHFLRWWARASVLSRFCRAIFRRARQRNVASSFCSTFLTSCGDASRPPRFAGTAYSINPNSRRRNGQRAMSVARGKIAFTMDERLGNIWMADSEARESPRLDGGCYALLSVGCSVRPPCRRAEGVTCKKTIEVRRTLSCLPPGVASTRNFIHVHYPRQLCTCAADPWRSLTWMRAIWA
jgi:hypothetical protein